MRLKLTDLSVTKLKNQHPQVTYWDALLPGFGVRVGSRSKTFIVMHGKARKRHKLGSYPVMTLQKARDAARLLLADPRTPERISVAAAVEHYLGSITVKSRTHSEYRRFLYQHLLPDLASRALDSVAARDILTITDDLLETPTECRHAHAAMKTFFAWCVPRYLTQSPMLGLKLPTKPNHRSRILTDEELARVWHASKDSGPFGLVVRLCILLATRRSEIPGPKTLEHTQVTFHDTKNGQDHTLPITSYMYSYLSRVRSTNSWSKNKRLLDLHSGVTGWVLHDLRRTTSSNLHRLGTDPFIVERILGHTLPTLQKIYNRHDFTEAMRAPLQKHQEWLFKMTGGR